MKLRTTSKRTKLLHVERSVKNKNQHTHSGGCEDLTWVLRDHELEAAVEIGKWHQYLYFTVRGIERTFM